MISESTIEKVFAAVRIEEVVGDYLPLKKKGTNYMGNCPFHEEKSPSYSVSPSKGIAHCFGCGKTNNSVSFLMDYKHMTFPEAIRFLADKYSILVEETAASQEQMNTKKIKEEIIEYFCWVQEILIQQLYDEANPLALEYANARFNADSIQRWGLGYAPQDFNFLYAASNARGYTDEFLLTTGLFKRSEKNGKIYPYLIDRLTFPIHDYKGRLIAFTGRTLPGAEANFAKYLNLPDTITYKKGQVLFGLNHAVANIAKTRSAILVEGNPDCIKLHQLEINHVVSPNGTSLTDNQIALLKRFADKVILLFDGDTAGQQAMIKYGKLLVKNDLTPYVAILPKDHDPDSFFTSRDQFDTWMNEHQEDFIQWFSNDCFSKAGEDPSLKEEAVNNISDLLTCCSVSKQDIYIDLITKKSKIKGKLFADRLKLLREESIPKKELFPKLPDTIDPNDFERWGFFEENNAYHFRTNNGIQQLSNFTMEPIFHIDSVHDAKRIYELTNEHGYRVVVNLDMNEMVSLQGFQKNVEAKGNFMFWGQMANFQKLKLKLYEQTRTCNEVTTLGWQKEGYWAWANGMTDLEGNFTPIDPYGVINFEGVNYFIPAFSKIYLRDKSVFVEERRFQYKSSNLSLHTWMTLYKQVHGENSMIAFAWYLACLFRDHILKQNSNFPLLNLFGQKGSGKNTLAYSLLSLFGPRQKEFNIHNGTKAGLAKHLEMFNNSIAFIDEYKNSLDFDKIETLKSIYNAIGRSRLNMDKGGKKETTEVNQGAIVAGQEMPTVDIALSTRMIFLMFQTKDGLPQEKKDQFHRLQEMEEEGLSHFTADFLQHRKFFIEHYKVNYDQVLRDLMDKTQSEEINDRIIRNACAAVAAFRTLVPKYQFSFTYDQLLDSARDIIIIHNRQIKQSDEIGVFWNLLEAMYDDNLLIDKWHFRVSIITKLLTKTRSLDFPEGKRVLRFKFNSVAKLYAEQLRKRGDKPLPQDSLQHYLQSSKHFLGIEKSCKFVRKDYVPGEGKVVEEKQTTTAFVFDYDQLDINLVRSLAEDTGAYYNENSLTHAHDDHFNAF